MISGFWGKLKKPIFALAPMADVTDAAFRQILAEHGKPDVIWTEFVSADGLCSRGKEKLLHHLWFQKNERPIVAQLFGSVPKHFYEAAILIQELGFDGIDINMGCPEKKIERQGAGAALINSPKIAQEIIRETKRGAGKLPVSVKTRIGYKENTLKNWLPFLLEESPAALTLHGRTRNEMSKVPANWNAIQEGAEIIKIYFGVKSRPIILGNGDCKDLKDAEEKVKAYGVDGVMIGRGVFGNPWFFNKTKNTQSVQETLSILIEHALLFESLFKNIKRFDVMKKHFASYVNGFPNAKSLRIELMRAKNALEAQSIAFSWLKKPHPIKSDEAILKFKL